MLRSTAAGSAPSSDNTIAVPFAAALAINRLSAVAPDVSISGTPAMRRTSTFGKPPLRDRSSSNSAAAAKKKGPFSWKTSTPGGKVLRAIALRLGIAISSTSSCTEVMNCLAAVTPAILRANRSEASTTPAAMASDRSTNTVRRKVTARTARSPGVLRRMRPNTRNSAILQHTMASTAPSAASGM